MAEKAVVLMNLGSPDSTSVSDVRGYLKEFLMDERVIDLPLLKRTLLVKGIIAPFRAPKSAKAYASIWTKEGSPLIVLTKQLQAAVAQSSGLPVYIAMRYGNPSPQFTYNQIVEDHPDIKEVVAVPLYPHYAMSSFETAAVYAREKWRKGNYPFSLKIIDAFYDNNDYLDVLAESMKPFLQKAYDHVLFSYHGVPERHIHKGDVTGEHCLKEPNCCVVDSIAHTKCYRHQCIHSTYAVAARLGLPKDKFSFSFQSRLGRDEWLKPYTAERFEKFPAEGKKNLVVVCPAFISDCLETLEEIAEEGKHAFMAAGGESFTMIPCLNVNEGWVKLLAEWVQHPEKIAVMSCGSFKKSG